MIKLMKRVKCNKVLFAVKINKPKFSNEAEILRSEVRELMLEELF